MAKEYPERVYIFDVNGTLDVGAKIENYFVLPAKEIFSFLQSLKGVWAGTWSGMYKWTQLQELLAADIRPDFVLSKSRGGYLQDEIIKTFKIDTTKFLVIGNSEEDKWFAYAFHFDYVDRIDFFKMYKEGEIK